MVKILTSKNKILLFSIVLISTIIITRLLVYYWKDPNIFINQMELHHFYYGIAILIITTIAILFGKSYPKLHTISAAIGIGFILDESLFVMSKIRGPTTYSSTLFSANTLAFILIIFILIISFDFLGRLNGHYKKK